MNAYLIKRVGLYLLGAGIGAGLGGLIANQIWKDEYEEVVGSDDVGEAEELTDEQREQIEDGSEIVETVTYEPMEDGEQVVKEKKTKKKGPQAPRVNPDIVDYNRFSKTARKDKTLNQVAQEAGVLEVEPGKPRIISLIEFLDPSRGYSQETLSYYDDDDVLCDEQEKPIPSPEELLGDALHHFGMSSDDPDMVYVRNDKTMTNYEVPRIHGKYSVIVAGIPDELEVRKGSSRRRDRTQKVTKHDDDNEDA